MIKTMRSAMVISGLLTTSGVAARLSLELEAGEQSDLFVIDLVWTMSITDTPAHDLDGLDARFNVDYPEGNSKRLVVLDVATLPGWTTPATEGIGDPFTEAFFLSIIDRSYVGIAGDGTEFSIVVGSIVLQAQGNVTGTEITFRHNSYQDPLPSAYDGPQNWQLRWQEEVNGPFQFDIGTGNPGDGDDFDGPYHGYETYQPVIIPEPGTSALLMSVVALCCRSRGGAERRRDHRAAPGRDRRVAADLRRGPAR